MPIVRTSLLMANVDQNSTLGFSFERDPSQSLFKYGQNEINLSPTGPILQNSSLLKLTALENTTSSFRTRGAAIARWICLCLPSCIPGFESQAHHLCFYHLQYLCYICHVKRTKINKKRPSLAHLKKVIEAKFRSS